MKSLTERILKLAERGIIYDMPIAWLRGQADETARLLPLIKSLAEIIEKQSEALRHYDNLIYATQAWPITRSDAVSKIATQALADTQARLKELGCGDE